VSYYLICIAFVTFRLIYSELAISIVRTTTVQAMKLDPDIPIVQNEAAIMTTLAAELFLKRLANQSQKICKNRGKNTIR
jgi:histone H3/H4